MQLYTDPRSLNSVKVLALLRHEGIEFELKSIDLLKGESHTNEFRALNPNEKVPVLIDGDLVLWESNAILQYLAEKTQSKLLPAGLPLRTEVNRWLFWHSSHWGPALGAITFERIMPHLIPGYQTDEGRVSRGLQDLGQLAKILDSHLQGRQYLVGDQLTIADFALAAHASERELVSIDLTPYSNITNWLKGIESLPAWQRAVPRVAA